MADAVGGPGPSSHDRLKNEASVHAYSHCGGRLWANVVRLLSSARPERRSCKAKVIRSNRIGGSWT